MEHPQPKPPPPWFRRESPPNLVDYLTRRLRGQASLQGIRHMESLKGHPPRPELPPIGYKRVWTKTVLPHATAFVHDALLYTIHNEYYPSTDPEVLNLPADVCRSIAAPGDLVLLYDQADPHYTSIAAIDPETRTINLLDRWPDILTGLLGASPKVVEARSGPATGAKLVRFTWEEYERLFVAAIVLDTAMFPAWLERVLPATRWTPEIQSALARSLLHGGRNRYFSHPAAVLITKAVQRARREGNIGLLGRCLPLMKVAMDLEYWTNMALGNVEAAERAADNATEATKLVVELEGGHGAGVVEEIDEDDAFAVACTAAAVLPEAALGYLDEAIGRNPGNRRAYLKRCQVRSMMLCKECHRYDGMAALVQGAIDDAEKAIGLLDARDEEMAARRSDYYERQGVYWETGRTAIEEDAEEMRESGEDRIQALRQRAALRLFTGDLKGSKADGLELVSLDPEAPAGYEIAGEAEALLGNVEASRKLMGSPLVRPFSERIWRIPAIPHSVR